MKHKIEDIVIQFKHICNFKVTLPYAQNLWGVNYEAELLEDVKADLLHLLTAKILYIKKRKRKDIKAVVALFTTRVVTRNVYN